MPERDTGPIDSYRAEYESNPSRAARLRDGLANRLNIAADPELSRKTILELADRIGVPMRLGYGGWPPRNTARGREADENEDHGAIYRIAPGADLDFVRWFLGTQESESGGVPVIVGDTDPVRNAAFLGDAFLRAFLEAGEDSEARLALVRAAVAWGQAVRAAVMRWDEEFRAGDDLARRWWGRIAVVIVDGTGTPHDLATETLPDENEKG